MSEHGEKPPLKLLVFNHNGTALDDLHLAYGSAEAFFTVLGLRCPSKGRYRDEIGANIMDFLWRHGVPRDITEGQFNVVRGLYYKMRQETVHYRKDFPDLLRECLKIGIQVGICSTEVPEVLRGLLKRARISDYFPPDLVRGGAWPSRTTTLTFMARASAFEPAECTYVDDTADGIGAGKEAGFHTIGFVHQTGYNSNKRIHDAKPDMVVGSFTELRKALPKLIAG